MDTARDSNISPYIREGSGLKPRWMVIFVWRALRISPYIREGSGLKPRRAPTCSCNPQISPYIREGSGLKRRYCTHGIARFLLSPLTSVRGAD